MEYDAYQDLRGSFARVFSSRDFLAIDKLFQPINVNISKNTHNFTLRGFHYSVGQSDETKIFNLLSGSIFNVTIDMRPTSKSYLAIEINELNHKARELLVVPGGCANAWMTLEPDTNLIYSVGSEYRPEDERGLRYDDPFFSIKWPNLPRVISNKDLSWPSFNNSDTNRSKI